MKKFLPLILVCAAVFVPMLFVHSCANTTQAPTGGVKDTIPPVIVAMSPANGSVNVPVKGAQISFTFNEYVVIKTATNIFLSPPQSKPLKTRIKGRKLIISFEEELLPNTTYIITMTDAIADNNEGNMFPGITYAFSTGSRIDSLFLTGTVLESRKLMPVKGATVMLYKNHADSAVMKERPYAAVKTDDWGFFCLPYLQDTTYRLYAIKDASGNNIYDKEEDHIAFADLPVRPVRRIVDSLPEMKNLDVKDTLACKSRESEHQLILFREKPDKQFIVNKVRTAERSAYITFQARNAWVDSLWIAGYPQDRIITQFNDEQDSLEIWVNDRRPALDTLHLFVSYRKTDSLNTLHPALEHIPLLMKTKDGKTILPSKMRRKAAGEIKHEDTICVYKLDVKPELVEQEGYSLEFSNPIIRENFKDMSFTYINPKQKEFKGEVEVKRDTANIRRYIIRPKLKMLKGYDYVLKIPKGCFTDITGYSSDSTVVKVTLPSGDDLSSLSLSCLNVEHRYIVELLDEKCENTIRKYVIEKSGDLDFPYLKEGKYAIRLTSDENRNSITDAGDLLKHRQPEKVIFYEKDGERLVPIPSGAEVNQPLDFKELFGK